MERYHLIRLDLKAWGENKRCGYCESSQEFVRSYQDDPRWDFKCAHCQMYNGSIATEPIRIKTK
ncbi:hypothetical protein HY573_02495 [Candidatus Parcubacteria bacterium]|nr:hypothetical protein [Candidatus Parcubacteria bacterium]